MRMQGRRLVVPPETGRRLLQMDRDPPRSVARSRERRFHGVDADPIRVEPEPGEAGPDVRPTESPAPGKGKDARDQARRGDRLRLENRDRLTVGPARCLLVVAG